METWVEEIEGWDDQSFSGGYDGLHDLADRDFSGAVSTGGTWLFMVNGRVVAVVQYRQTRAGSEVVDADIERFDDASGTAYAAPDSSIPLLIAMKTRDGETRGSYYSVKTPVDEVAATLEDGGFTGYVELSENVLSGDYYSVYQAGRSMDLAFIGNARRLLTGEEAHERMVDEVGIYEVTAVDLDVVEIPGGSDDAAGAAGAAGAGAVGAAGAAMGSADEADAADEPAPDTADAAPEEPDDATPATEPVSESGPGDAVAEDPTEPTDGADTTASATGTASTDETPAEPDAADDAEPDTADEPDAADDSEPEPTASGDESPAASSEPVSEDAAPASNPGPAGAASDRDSTPTSPTEGVISRSVPSLDPSRSAVPTAEEPAEEPTDPEPSTASGDAPTPTADPDEMADLRDDLRAAREKLADMRSELESTREERDALAARVEELEARIRDLESGGGSGPALSLAEALAGTNLFVRHTSKSNLTVEDAHEGAGDRAELLENLQLDHHTQFESAGATVDGRPFDDWLASLDRMQFAEWLVTTLLFEIRETGSVERLGKLYDALPAVDRVELDGSVTVAGEDGEETLGFDLVTRDRMGEPLTVTTLVDSREPVSETAMGELVTDATVVAEAHDSLAGAFYVTSAFFSPEALETAREATSGSLLSRDRRQSYVKLSRNRGYHLGLVESREETFHLSVPDL